MVVIIREERKKAKEDGRQKADVTRDLGHGLWFLSFYQLTLREVKLPSVSPVLSIPILETARTHARISSPF